MRGTKRKDALACQVSLGLFAGLLGIASTAHGAPSHDGGTIVADGLVKAGNVTIDTKTTDTTKITSTQTNNIIRWKDFSIKSNEIVEFDGGKTTEAEGAKNYLNIVTGNVTSQIDGTMKGGNNVYIANTHGVIFGQGAKVDVGNLYVTTRELTTADYTDAKISTGAVIDTSAAKAAASAKADVVSLVDGTGNQLKANTIVMEGKSVRILNDENIKSNDVYALADTRPLTIDSKEVRPYTGYVHVGYDKDAPTTGAGNKYKNLKEKNIYKLVSDATALKAMATNDEDANYMLRTDITLPSGTHTAIGSAAAPFKGRFDGMFHKITGLKLGEGTATEWVGLFGTTDKATIMNVGLRGADLSDVKYGGGLVGQATDGTIISAVYNEAGVKGIGSSAAYFAGGLVGKLDGSSLDTAYNTTEMGGAGSSGFVGYFSGNSKIYAVYNTGELNGGSAVYGTVDGSDGKVVQDAYTTKGKTIGPESDKITFRSYALEGKTDGDAKQAATYAGWDISDEGGANQTWRIFAGQSYPLLTAFMQGTVQAEYSYADFQQPSAGGNAPQTHTNNNASSYTTQAADKKADGSYVKRPGTESNGGRSIVDRVYNADYLKIAKKNGDGSYSQVTSVGTTDDDIKLYGINKAADRNLVQLNHGADGGGRRNAGKEAMLVSGQHGYDIAGANVKIKPRKVIGEVAQMGKIEREYNGNADAGKAFLDAIAAGDVSVRATGLVDGDGAAMTIDPNGVTFRQKDNWTASAALSPDAGYNKSIYVDSSKVHFGDDNYEFDATQINDKQLKGNILQKTIKATLTNENAINKTYDGTSKVVGTDDQPNPNLVVDDPTSFVPEDNMALDRDHVTAKYMDKASNTEALNAGTHDVAYQNVKLKSTTPAKTKNYKLVDKDGNVLYREALDDDPNTAVTSGGTVWGTGTITKRKIDASTFTVIDASTFTVTGGNKVYDGTDYLVVDGTTRKVQGTVDTEAGTAKDTGKNVIKEDKDKLLFTISAADNKAYYKNSATSTENTKDVYDEHKNPNGAQVLSYTLKASDTTKGKTLANYELDYGSGKTRALNTTEEYDATGEGFITPRTITLDLLKKTGINKTYDGNPDVLAADKQFGTNFGYADGTLNKNKLVKDDGAPDDGAGITATAAVYKKKASGLETADKDVSRKGGTATGAVIANGKDVEYKIGLTGTNAATNYRLQYTENSVMQQTNGNASDTVTMNGTGTIEPKELKAQIRTVARAYNNTSEVAPSQLAGKYTLLGIVTGDENKVSLDTKATSSIKGTYYKGNTKVKNRGTDYTVKYKGISHALVEGTAGDESRNYWIADTAEGLGDITKLLLTKDNFVMTLGVDGKVKKTYDGTSSAYDKDLTRVRVGTETIYPGADGYSIERGSSKYYYGISETEARDANADETGKEFEGLYSVQYTITLQGNAKDNYDTSSLDGQISADGGQYKVNGDKISFKKGGIGYIKARKVYAKIGDSYKGTSPENTPKKIYDGTNKLESKGEFVQFSKGVESDTGLASGDGTKNISKAFYESYKAGDPKKGSVQNVRYEPKVGNVSEKNYVFYHAEGEHQGQKVDDAHPLKGKGIITQAELIVKASNDVNRPYNGDIDVKAGQGRLRLDTPLKHESAPGKDDVETDGVLDDVQINGIDETKDGTGDVSKYYRYYNAADANVGDSEEDKEKQKTYVTYRRIQLTGKDAGNYKLVYTKGKALATENYGDDKTYYKMNGYGLIEKRKVNSDDFTLNFAGVKKTYDGTEIVKYEKDPLNADRYVSEVSVNLGGTVGKKFFTVEDGSYTLNASRTKYADKNVASNQGRGAVTYTLDLNRDLLKNYDFTDLNNAAGQAAGYSYDSVNHAVSRTLEVGTITKRPVYAHVANPNVTKTYNAKKDVIDESGKELKGDQLVTFNNVKNGAVQAEAGLVDSDKLQNATTASYTEKKVGDKNRTIDYTLALSGDAELINNYELQDENGNAAATLTTTTNTINRRALRLKADAVTKVYDATKMVKVDGADSATDRGLGYFNESEDRQKDKDNHPDVFSIAAGYAREYQSEKATRTEEDKKDNVAYYGVKLTGTDAENYYLADSEGKALELAPTVPQTLPLTTPTDGYKMFGYGEITRFQVTKNNFKLNFLTQPIKKTYDGTANVGVGDAAHNQPAKWEDYITDSYVTDSSNNRLFDIDIEKVNSATYRNAGNTADDKNVGTGKKVLFNLKFSEAAQNNFEFSDDFYTADTDGNQMLSDGTYNRYTQGDITKRVLQAALAQGTNIRKVYDGTTATDKGNLLISNFVEADKDKLTKTATFDKATATVNPGATAQNTRQITYTATLTGDAADNYAFDTLAGPASKTLTATGDIERRKVYANVTGAREKTYDAGTKVLIGGAERTGEALVTFGKRTESDKDTGLLTGYGTNATTAVYTDADASDTANKTVKYTLKIEGKDADGTDYANNYVVYDEEHKDNIVYDAAAGNNDGLTTTANTIKRAPLTVTADYATKQYDGGKKVKHLGPDTLLKITGGWQGTDGGDLNHTAYTATYLDENVNQKGVDYDNIQLVGTGSTKASNYVLSYNGKEVARSGETYSLHGEGEITKRILTGDDLKAGFTTTPIKKSYDGTADVKNPVQYVNYMRTRYTKDDGTPLDLAADGYAVERADYVASANTAAKDVGKGKDVKFQFALSDGNFDYSGLKGWTPDANGVYHFSQNYDRETLSDGTTVGRGEITGRRVALTLRLVQKVYDGTTDVKDGYYTKDGTGKLIEHNPTLDWKKVITLDGDGKIAGDENSGFAHGEKLDFTATGAYKDANANRDPHYTGPLQPANKDVTYTMRLNDPTANKNYSFQIRVVDAAGNTLKTDTSQSFIDPQAGDGHTFGGLGNIWQKQLTLKKNGWDKNYDGNADVTDAVKKGMQFNGVADSDSTFFNFSDPNNAHANTFAEKLSGRYGDRAVEGSFANTPGNTNVYKHVKRPAGNVHGTPEVRDVELTGVKNALESLQTPGSVANNYFYDGENTVYGTGLIKPLTLNAKKTWQRNGADFSKTYDGSPLAKIGGKALGTENKQDFHEKLKLSVDLGTGESPIELDYTLYGDESGDYDGYRPHYENLSGGIAHHGQSDANVKNSADPSDTTNKDIVYKLKRINGDKAWANQPESERYKDWELSENLSGAELRLSDAATDPNTDNRAGLKAVITPKKVEVQADKYSKIYDGTSSLTAPSLSADALAKKQRELRSKLHVTDEKTAKMLRDDGIDFTVDTDQSQFLNKTSRTADANVVRDAEGKPAEDGKLVEYRLQKTGDAVRQGNYELPSEHQTDTVLGVGSITPRIVQVEFDPTDANTKIKTPDKIYDGTRYTVKDGALFKRKLRLVDAAGDEGVVAADAGDVKLNHTENVGTFATPNVQKDSSGRVQAQDVTYHDGIALINGSNKAGNYTLVSDNLKDTAKITPRPITATLKNEPIVKEYDGTTTVKDLVKRTSTGGFTTETLFREGNIHLEDKNAAVAGIAAPSLPVWSSEDKEKGLTLTKAEYDNENFGTGKRVTYDIGLNSDNYMLVGADGNSLTTNDRTAQITSSQGKIDRRKIFVGIRKDANKIYDGNTNVRKALDDLKFTYNGESAEQNEENGIVAKDRETVNEALRVKGAYTDDANAADNDAQDYKTHGVRYTFEKDEADRVLANYEITTANGDNTVDGKGIIRRRTLNVLPDWKTTYAGVEGVDFTGRIEDGANEDSALTEDVRSDLRTFNNGTVFKYRPEEPLDYNTPGSKTIYGWYSKNGEDTPASGFYGQNYTLKQVPSTLGITPRIDGVDRGIRPDSKVYENAAYDQHNTFGKLGDQDAALSYRDKGVNDGSVKTPQAGIVNGGVNLTGGAAEAGTGKLGGADTAAQEAEKAAGANAGRSGNGALAGSGTAGAGIGGNATDAGTVGANAGRSGNGTLAGGTTGAGIGGNTADAGTAGANAGRSGNGVLAGGTTGAGIGGNTADAGTAGANAGRSGNSALAGSDTTNAGGSYRPSNAGAGTMGGSGSSRVTSGAGSAGAAQQGAASASAIDRGLAAAVGASTAQSSAKTGADSLTSSAGTAGKTGTKASSYSAVDQGLANALGRSGSGTTGYYNGTGFSQTDDDEEEEIKKRAKASA